MQDAYRAMFVAGTVHHMVVRVIVGVITGRRRGSKFLFKSKHCYMGCSCNASGMADWQSVRSIANYRKKVCANSRCSEGWTQEHATVTVAVVASRVFEQLFQNSGRIYS